jgi:ATPase subunit of ABC transporter with duplicated ATPase domains
MLARALLRDADLLVLDEPEAHLDAASVDELAAILRGVARERRIIAVVHDRGLARFADRIIEITAPPPSHD